MRQARKDILAERAVSKDAAEDGAKGADDKKAADKPDAGMTNMLGSTTQRKDKSPTMSELARNNKLP